jgi:hypothetical protein
MPERVAGRQRTRNLGPSPANTGAETRLSRAFSISSGSFTAAQSAPYGNREGDSSQVKAVRPLDKICGRALGADSEEDKREDPARKPAFALSV